MKYKLIASDFDNTLAGKDCIMSDYTINVIKEYVKRGGKFILNTGRIFSASKKFADQLGLKGELVVFQGAAIFDIESQKMLYSDYIDKQTAVEIFKIFEKVNYIVVHGYSDKNYYVDKDNPVSKQYDKFCGIVGEKINKKLSDFFSSTEEKCLKIVAFVPREKIDEYVKLINDNFSSTVFAMKSQATYLEITNKNTSKGNALKYIAEQNKIKREEIISFGDATNDISMLQYAGIGVAVGNAMPEVKEIADYVSEPVSENGVAKTIVDLCFDGKDI